MRFFIPLFISFFLSSCQSQRLLVEMEYVSERSLASYWVRTPDPKLACPNIGQRLIVSWWVPPEALDDLSMELTIRFGNHEEEHLSIPIKRFRDSYTYGIYNGDYWEKRGIQTYRAQIISSEGIVDEWTHQLWAEFIRFDEEPSY